MAQLSIRVPDEMKEELEKIAKEERRSVAFIVKEAIQQYLNSIIVRQED
jgi:predicted DNA-binding protein